MLTLEGNGGWSIGHSEDTWSDEKGRIEFGRWAIYSLYRDTRRISDRYVLLFKFEFDSKYVPLFVYGI